MQNPNEHETYLRGQYVRRESIEATDDTDNSEWSFGGVACAAGDILRSNDGDPVLLTAEELAKAEFAPASSRLTKDHPDYEGQSPPVDDTVGSVSAMHYDPGSESVVYDATTHDENVASGVKRGTYDVSIHAGFSKGDRDPETGAYVGEDIVFKDLSTVSVGASPSNTAEWGGRSDVAAWARSGGLEAALDTTDDTDGQGDTVSADGAGAEQQSLVSSAVNGTLRALGFDAGAVNDQAALTASESGDTESATDTDPDMTNRDDHIQFITANSDYDEDDLEEMSDDAVEQTRDLVDDEDEDGDGDEDEQTADTLGDMTPDQLGDVLREQGFVTEDEVGDAVEASRSAATKGEQVDEIIANSEDYSEDDREELMASSPTVVEKIHGSETAPGAAPAPATGGARDQVRASVSGLGEHDLEDYRTGGDD